MNLKMDPGEKWHDYVQLLQLKAELLYQKNSDKPFQTIGVCVEYKSLVVISFYRDFTCFLSTEILF